MLKRIIKSLQGKTESQPMQTDPPKTLIKRKVKQPTRKEPPAKKISDETELYRLVYTSARSQSCDESCIDEILKAAEKNNPGLGLTGILVHTPKRFLQILEGKHDDILKLYQKIEKDKRHGGVQKRYFEPTSERHFGNWHMARKAIRSSEVDYATAVSDQEKALYSALMDGNLHDYKDNGMRVLKTFLMIS